jgi:outer membrane protein OmpA-like peptidoglycan-associated protein
MRLSCNHVPLSPCLGSDAGLVVLVAAIDALTLCRDDEYESLPAWKVARQFERQWRSLDLQIGRFASRSDMIGLRDAWLDDEGRAKRLLLAIESGHLVGVRRRTQSAEGDSSREHQRLVRRIEKHGRLLDAGREYKLVAAADLGGLSGRDSFEVVRRDDALAVLDRLARQAPRSAALAPLLAEAAGILSPNWRAPMLPTGVVLLRRIAARAVASTAPQPVITPSQMRAMLESEKPVEFFARFVDDHGNPVADFAAQFEHGGDPGFDIPFTGPGFSHIGDRKGAKQALLTIAEEAHDKLVKVLRNRWNAIRQPPDPMWRENLEAKQERLLDVVLDDQEPVSLSLEDGKKHTFVLRPPVAVAHLFGFYFDSNRCFLLPSALPDIKRLCLACAKHPGWDVLVIGHADTAGTDHDNMDLSAERAAVMTAYLTGDVEGWLAWYGDDVLQGKRWGKSEDRDMMGALVPRSERRSMSRVRAYQSWHNRQDSADDELANPDGWAALPEDGVMTAETRRQLVLDYMNLDGTSLPEHARAFTYACGELYPLPQDDDATDDEGEDGGHARQNRRVELLLFGKPFGILPELPTSAEGDHEVPQARQGDGLYPEWRARAVQEYTMDGAERELLLLDELGEPLSGANVRWTVSPGEDVELTSDQEGKIRLDVPDDCKLDVLIDGVHEGGGGDSLQTRSGRHFAEGTDGPAVET